MIAWDTKETDDADWARTVAGAESENKQADRENDKRIDQLFERAEQQLP